MENTIVENPQTGMLPTECKHGKPWGLMGIPFLHSVRNMEMSMLVVFPRYLLTSGNILYHLSSNTLQIGSGRKLAVRVGPRVGFSVIFCI